MSLLDTEVIEATAGVKRPERREEERPPTPSPSPTASHIIYRKFGAPIPLVSLGSDGKMISRKTAQILEAFRTLSICY